MKVAADALTGVESAEAWDHLQQQVLADVRALARREIQIADDAARVNASAVRIRGRWCSIDIGFAPSVSLIDDPKGVASRRPKPVANLS